MRTEGHRNLWGGGGLAPAFASAAASGWGFVPGAVSAPALARLARAALGPGGPRLDPLEPLVGPVRQCGRSGVVPVAAHRAFGLLAGELAAVAPGGWRPDEVAVSLYDRTGGISPHRDNARFEGFVVTVTLVGLADVDWVADRDGRRVLSTARCGPGDVLVLRGNPLSVVAGAEDLRPLHRVGPPIGGGPRAVLVVRRNRAGPGRGWR